MSKAGLLKSQGWTVIDITVKSGMREFAPSWDIVMGFKNQTLSEDGYTDIYLKMMRDSYKKYPTAWKKLLSTEKLCLACYCKTGDFCHRYLLRDILVKTGKAWGVSVEVIPER